MSGWMNKRPRDPHPERERERESEREGKREGKSDFIFRRGVWCERKMRRWRRTRRRRRGGGMDSVGEVSS